MATADLKTLLENELSEILDKMALAWSLSEWLLLDKKKQELTDALEELCGKR